MCTSFLRLPRLGRVITSTSYSDLYTYIVSSNSWCENHYSSGYSTLQWSSESTWRMWLSAIYRNCMELFHRYLGTPLIHSVLLCFADALELRTSISHTCHDLGQERVKSHWTGWGQGRNSCFFGGIPVRRQGIWGDMCLFWTFSGVVPSPQAKLILLLVNPANGRISVLNRSSGGENKPTQYSPHKHTKLLESRLSMWARVVSFFSGVARVFCW